MYIMEKKYALDEYQHVFKNFFKDELKSIKTLYTDTMSKKTERN